MQTKRMLNMHRQNNLQIMNGSFRRDRLDFAVWQSLPGGRVAEEVRCVDQRDETK
jgi:hypothetical protein